MILAGKLSCILENFNNLQMIGLLSEENFLPLLPRLKDWKFNDHFGDKSCHNKISEVLQVIWLMHLISLIFLIFLWQNFNFLFPVLVHCYMRFWLSRFLKFIYLVSFMTMWTLTTKIIFNQLLVFIMYKVGYYVCNSEYLLYAFGHQYFIFDYLLFLCVTNHLRFAFYIC